MIDYCEKVYVTSGVGGSEEGCVCSKEKRKNCPTCKGTGRYFACTASLLSRKLCTKCSSKEDCVAGRFVLHNQPRTRK